MKKDIGLVSSNGIVCIHKKETMKQAFDLMKGLTARHLPVVDDNDTIIGMLSDRDVQRAMRRSQSEGWSVLEIEPKFDPDDLVFEFMSWPIQTIDESFSIALAAELMIEKKISSLIVTRNKFASGIVTSEDLLKILVQEQQNSLDSVKENITGLIYRSPIGSIARMLSNVGI